MRKIIDMVRSKALEQGFEIGVYNRRGVTVRMPHDGGESAGMPFCLIRPSEIKLHFSDKILASRLKNMYKYRTG